jgi:hypothetical protein
MESIEHRDTDAIDCACGRPARRFVSAAHVPNANGFTAKPTREHYVHLNRAVEAQHEIVYQAEKQHIEPPDLWKIAKRRIARGDVAAIEA